MVVLVLIFFVPITLQRKYFVLKISEIKKGFYFLLTKKKKHNNPVSYKYSYIFFKFPFSLFELFEKYYHFEIIKILRCDNSQFYTKQAFVQKTPAFPNYQNELKYQDEQFTNHSKHLSIICERMFKIKPIIVFCLLRFIGKYICFKYLLRHNKTDKTFNATNLLILSLCQISS